jgi:hypothetical protein
MVDCHKSHRYRLHGVGTILTGQNFDWANNTLFFDEIPNAADPRKTAIFLAARDIIIDAPVR